MAAGEMVLLVNDIPDHVVSYQRALTTHGFRVRLARTGKDALKIVKESIPECAVIDLRLPDMSGWDLCREMKETARTGEGNADRRAHTGRVEDVRRRQRQGGLRRMAGSSDCGRRPRPDHQASARAGVRVARLTRVGVAPSHPLRRCGSDQVRPTLRMAAIQYYCCKGCGFCWRAETLRPATEVRLKPDTTYESRSG